MMFFESYGHSHWTGISQQILKGRRERVIDYYMRTIFKRVLHCVQEYNRIKENGKKWWIKRILGFVYNCLEGNTLITDGGSKYLVTVGQIILHL